MRTSRFLESELVLSRNPMLISSRQVRRLSILTSTRCTEVRNARTADDAETRYEPALKHGERTDILTIAQFVVSREISREHDPQHNVKMLRRETQSPDFGCQLFDFRPEVLSRDSERVCPGFQAWSTLVLSFFTHISANFPAGIATKLP